MLDLIIKNGLVASSKELKKADIHIKDGKIIDIIFPDSTNIDAKNIIDAENMLVMPGGIDVHTHLDMPFMGTFSTDDFNTGSIAAAFGGTTTIVDFIIPQKEQTLKEAAYIWHKKAENKSFIDYGFHMAIVPPIDKVIDELSELPKLGITSIKCFLAYKNALMLNDTSLYLLMSEAKKHGILVSIHAENGEIIDVLTKQFLSEGKTEPIYHAYSRPDILEGESVSKVLKLAKLADIPVYFVHTSTKDAVLEIKSARANGQKVYIETCPQYLAFSEERYLEPNFEGAKYVMSPPLRPLLHKEYLLNALDEDIDVVATDHCPFYFSKEKQFGQNNFTKIPNGAPGIETRMPFMYTEMVVKKGLPVTKFVELNCTKPAEIFGIQNKGDIQVGMDADIVIWDSNLKWTIKYDNLHQNVDYTPFEGYEATGKPVTVILRGNIIISDGQFGKSPAGGQFVKRNVNSEEYAIKS